MFPFLLELILPCHFLLLSLVRCDGIEHAVINHVPSSQLQCIRPESLSIAPLDTPNRLHPLDPDPEAYCIFFNPNINQEELPVPSSIEIVKMPEKGGVGAVAAHDLKRGEPIARIRAVGIFANDPRLWWTEFGRTYRRQAIELLPLRTRDMINNLASSETENSYDEFLESALKVNTFTTILDSESSIGHSALVLEPAVRLNHACRPNVGYSMDNTTQTLHMMALRDIPEGEELTISYRAPELPHQVRRDALEFFYGFRCSCSHCQLSSEQRRISDERVQRIIELQYMHYNEQEWLSITQVLDLIKLCQQERLPYPLINAYYIAAQVYNAHGKTQQAIYFSGKAKEDGLMFEGPWWEYLEEAKILSESPEKHDSYSNVIRED
ncbi:hypothetical protein PCANC_09277 [Puccinia coronata f. sp. avenae]|uniref:SET domain-containing protein n=1 Tax=Puccinia coronata f. sp. avenae TaxID=200324 RepID=A0A2N5T5M1_9BASI|nr:hypothetical protein PCANC_09277 [Puccinia coronata f. sp. avenae]